MKTAEYQVLIPYVGHRKIVVEALSEADAIEQARIHLAGEQHDVEFYFHEAQATFTGTTFDD